MKCQVPTTTKKKWWPIQGKPMLNEAEGDVLTLLESTCIVECRIAALNIFFITKRQPQPPGKPNVET